MATTQAVSREQNSTFCVPIRSESAPSRELNKALANPALEKTAPEIRATCSDSGAIPLI